MLINADFSCRAALTPSQYDWVASPQTGVERVMLDRVGLEKARATSIVRYAPDSRFPYHQHPGGEEILVLTGTFSDESGDYPAGSYLRNPPGSGHAPFSHEGATIFVKLWQMQPRELDHVCINTWDPMHWATLDDRRHCALFSDGSEHVSLEQLQAYAQLFTTSVGGGAELLILQGCLQEGAHEYPQGSWLRLPRGDYPEFAAGNAGVRLFLKTGHLGTVAIL